ncbi:GNAT family N-acetyltransferase [Calidifontibacter terrae]
MSDRHWPVAVAGEFDGHRILLRPLRVRADRNEFLRLRSQNARWNAPWDSTPPTRIGGTVSYPQLVRAYDGEAKAGRMLPFVVEVDGVLSGQMHLASIERGALLSATAGYWITESLAGQGITPFALALAMDHAFGAEGLHRVEVNIRPDNPRSLRVVEKLGMRSEGLRQAYLHIDGAWRDHLSFALTVEDLAGERVVDRLGRLGAQ